MAAPGRARLISSMSLDEKIGQLFVFAGHGTFMNEGSTAYQRFLRQVRDNRVGGVLWFVSDVYETAWLNHKLQREAATPLLISADLESGMGMRFPDATFWPWPMAVAATGDPSWAEKEGQIVAREAKLLGINHIYAPVADVNNNAGNPVINARSFGEDPAAVARFVAAFVRGVQSEGVLATVKHFPGHGDTETDSHRSLPVLRVDRARLDAIELVPFREAFAAGVGSVMTAHLSVPVLDATPAPVRETRDAGENPYTADLSEASPDATMPASLSAPMSDRLLREELGFKGVVITDALDMGGLVDHFTPGEAAVRAIEAGADLLPKSPDTDAAIRGVKEAVRSGRITEARIDRSVERILLAKSRLAPTPYDMDAIFRELDPPANRAVAQEIASRAVTLVREGAGALPIRSEARVVELVISDFPEPGFALGDLDAGLRARLRAPHTRFVLDRNSREEATLPIMAAARAADVVLVAFTVRVRSGEGKVGVPDVARRVLEQIATLNVPRIAVSFGTPYLLREVPSLETYIAAYGVQPVMQTAVVRAIFGESAISGRLPVTIPGLARLGEGIRKEATMPAR
ncbi:MAG TPA: glycoside hydrolase family 3 N-terminal domain-containing protein [Thermoanaerobaculia bacterium]|nr:glycoside hydrolase family 3 N-terminal domain-containing protein [Thermoanaerobaculia bacterium]